MGIGGINDYSSILANYRVPSIPQVDIEQVKKQQENAALSQDFTPVISSPIVEEPRSREQVSQTNLEDISLSFNLAEDYSYIGSESDIAALDIEKAISDMKKDQILHQYQYFVGSSAELTQTEGNADGKVIIKF